MRRKLIIPDLKQEQLLWQQGYLHVAGVDEAGRGPLAGPITAGAVVIHNTSQVVEIVRDSKYMSAKNREIAFDLICSASSAFGIGMVNAQEIDQLGISLANKLVMERALQELEKNFRLSLSFVLVDGSRTLPLDGYKSLRIKTGGLYHYSIAAGSVLAKITRDRIMHEYAMIYPHYGFDHHVGYGTPAHYQALESYGPCPIHRHTFLHAEEYDRKSN